MVSTLINRPEEIVKSQVLGSSAVSSKAVDASLVVKGVSAGKVTNLAHKNLQAEESKPKKHVLDQKLLVSRIKAKVKTSGPFREMVESAKKTFSDWKEAYYKYMVHKENMPTNEIFNKVVDERDDVNNRLVEKRKDLTDLNKAIKILKRRLIKLKNFNAMSKPVKEHHINHLKKLQKDNKDNKKILRSLINNDPKKLQEDYEKNRENLKKIVNMKSKVEKDISALLSKKDELDDLISIHEAPLKEKREKCNGIKQVLMLEMKGLVEVVFGEEVSHDFEVDYESLAYEVRHIDTSTPVVIEDVAFSYVDYQTDVLAYSTSAASRKNDYQTNVFLSSSANTDSSNNDYQTDVLASSISATSRTDITPDKQLKKKRKFFNRVRNIKNICKERLQTAINKRKQKKHQSSTTEIKKENSLPSNSVKRDSIPTMSISKMNDILTGSNQPNPQVYREAQDYPVDFYPYSFEAKILENSVNDTNTNIVNRIKSAFLNFWHAIINAFKNI